MGEHESGQVPPAVVADARRAAEHAAQAAGVVLHEVVEGDQATAIGALFDRIWGMPATTPVLPEEVLRVYVLTGQYLAQARDARSGELLAASVGLLAAPFGTTLHSHITGALPHARGRSVGFALKLHQRVWALQRDLTRITWTYDPLIRRNAWFNLTKLAARAVRYVPEFYGSMPDAVNAEDLSDRLYLHWQLTSAEVIAACSGAACPAAPRRVDSALLRELGHRVLLGRSPDGASPLPLQPLEASDPADGSPSRGLLVALPDRVEAMRREHPDLARRWRLEVRAALTGALDVGWRIGAVTTDGYYVLHPPQAGRTP